MAIKFKTDLRIYVPHVWLLSSEEFYSPTYFCKCSNFIPGKFVLFAGLNDILLDEDKTWSLRVVRKTSSSFKPSWPE